MWHAIRNNRLFKIIRNKVSNKIVNIFFHFPKAILANIIYRFPSRKLKLIGITGTKGKTSTAHFLFHILRSSNKKVVMVSTIGIQFGNKFHLSGLHVTNPSPFAIQKILFKANRMHYEYAILEITSHGLAQYRNWGIKFDIGLFTQISSDHLLYHKTLIEYRKAKSILLTNSRRIIINKFDPAFDFLISLAVTRNIPYFVYQGKKDDFDSQNKEAAITAASKLGISRTMATKALEKISSIPGRMEIVQQEPFKIIIDFAHTPDSLKAALINIKKYIAKNGRLIAVFGCAGERDIGRRKMGRVAAEYSDLFIITAEDPRTENIDEISQKIADFALNAEAIEAYSKQDMIAKKEKVNKRAVFMRINDRQNAIDFAVDIAQKGDVIGLFGKGHEKSMCFGIKEIPWSEHQAVKKALTKTNN